MVNQRMVEMVNQRMVEMVNQRMVKIKIFNIICYPYK